MFPATRVRLLAAAAWAVSITAGATPRGMAPPAIGAAREALSVDWRFRAGSTVHVPPVVGSDGTAYVGTSDGSLEAVGPDGVLRWSVTLEGAVIWAPVKDGSGRLYVATAGQRIHSFLPSGARGWVLRSPVAVATDPVVAPWGLLFGAADGSIWAVSSRGAALWHADVGQPISASPGVRGRRIVIGTAAGDALFFDGAEKRFAARLGATIRCPPAVLEDGSAVVLAGSSVLRLDSHGAVLWRRDGFDWLGADGDGIYAASEQGELVRFAGDGTPARSIHVGVSISAPPVVGGDGSVFVPADSGDVVLVRTDGSLRVVRVAAAPLHRPVLDPSRRRLLVTAGDGTLAALTLPD